MFSTTNLWIRAGLGLLIIRFWSIPSCVFSFALGGALCFAWADFEVLLFQGR